MKLKALPIKDVGRFASLTLKVRPLRRRVHGWRARSRGFGEHCSPPAQPVGMQGRPWEGRVARPCREPSCRVLVPCRTPRQPCPQRRSAEIFRFNRSVRTAPRPVHQRLKPSGQRKSLTPLLASFSVRVAQRHTTFANAAFARSMVCATSSSLCAADTKPASKADGAR